MLRKQDILITSLGNAMEWFDFGLFIFLAPLLGHIFFPFPNSNTTTLASLSVFALGYICRPLGGILFGHYGDKTGRARSLRISMLLMTLPTFIIGLLPGYDVIGFFAPLLFTLVRIVQGISIGGEYSGIMIYLAESSPPSKRGFITSFAGSGASCGMLLSILTILMLRNIISLDSLNTWGWRIPFLLMGLVGSIIFLNRFRLAETPVFQQLEKEKHIDKFPLWKALRFAPQNFLRILGLTCLSASFYSIVVLYMPKYFSDIQSISTNQSLFVECISITITMFCIPLAGKLGDFFWT